MTKKKKRKKTALEERLETQAAQETETAEDAQDEAAAAPDAEALMAERDDLKDQLLRARAEFDNYRKRMARDAERVRKTAAESLMGDLLAVVDNLERALEHAEDDSGGFVEGVGMVLKQLRDVLGRHGLEPIAAAGEPFDPNVHEAMIPVQSEEHPKDHVVEEFQKGYRLGDYILRPAKVSVNTKAAESADAEAEAEG
ncbi:MAG: nucleotide exchange factor GrpE [Nitrospiraceae bacterium]|nr:nucleotide exchange factor GrpE [Nitrospiraceae bacterium]